MKRIIIPLLIAAFLWFFMFSPWTSGIFNFWTAMSFSAIVLMNMAFALRPQWWIEDVKFDWKNIAGGVGLAVVLWGVFWLGDKASAWLFDFARPQVELIYGIFKMIRAIALVKQGNLEFKRILHPRMVRPLIIGNKVIDKQIIFSVMAFLMLYTVIALISTIVFLLSGLDGLTSFSAALACLNNLGPALGSLGPSYNFSALSDFQVLFCCFLMVIGRLELFTVLVLFTRGFWRA